MGGGSGGSKEDKMCKKKQLPNNSERVILVMTILWPSYSCVPFCSEEEEENKSHPVSVCVREGGCVGDGEGGREWPGGGGEGWGQTDRRAERQTDRDF